MYRRRPPPGSARDAVSIPREFANEFVNFKRENEKRKNFNSQPLLWIKSPSDHWADHFFSATTVIMAIVTIKWKPGLTGTVANEEFIASSNLFATNLALPSVEGAPHQTFLHGLDPSLCECNTCKSLAKKILCCYASYCLFSLFVGTTELALQHICFDRFCTVIYV